MGLSLSNALPKILATKWDHFNNFGIKLIDNEHQVLNKCGFKTDTIKDINLYVVSVSPGQRTNEGIQVFDGANWRVHNGRDALYTLSITFRDHDGLSLYTGFTNLYNVTRESYFNSAAIGVTVDKYDDGFAISSDEENKYHILTSIVYYPAIIDSISGLSFNTTQESQILEFTVEFKATDMSVGVLK
jgi:hypothetical protein